MNKNDKGINNFCMKSGSLILYINLFIDIFAHAMYNNILKMIN